MEPTQADLIETALHYAQQFGDLGVPLDITAADARITANTVQHSDMEGNSGLVTWQGTEWTVIIRGRWAVDLDEMGVPKGPSRVLRASRVQ